MVTLYIDSNHSNRTQPNIDLKVFQKHRVNDHPLTLPLPVVPMIHNWVLATIQGYRLQSANIVIKQTLHLVILE